MTLKISSYSHVELITRKSWIGFVPGSENYCIRYQSSAIIDFCHLWPISNNSPPLSKGVLFCSIVKVEDLSTRRDELQVEDTTRRNRRTFLEGALSAYFDSSSPDIDLIKRLNGITNGFMRRHQICPVSSFLNWAVESGVGGHFLER